jgi:hypothetical protein
MCYLYNMVDNFKLIGSLLDFTKQQNEPGYFYFVQILKRRKENPAMRTGTSVIDNLYIYSPEDLEKLREKILERCTKNNARAYINLNKLDLEKVAMYTVKQCMDYIIQGDYKAVKNAYATVCGSHHSEKNKRWLIDLDAEHLERKDEIRQIVEDLHNQIKKSQYKILAEVPTKSGVHIITNPFNMEAFRQIQTMRATGPGDPILHIDIQKNSPTILYIP